MTTATLAESSIYACVAALAARTPAPGGGAAAAIAASLAAATGAMAARYTTGGKWAEVSEEAEALVKQLDELASKCLTLAQADASAYARVMATSKESPERSQAEAEAAAIPVTLLGTCLAGSEALTMFRPRCNPRMLSDVDTALHLFAGAARSAVQTRLTVACDQATRTALADMLARIARYESAAGTLPS